MTIHNSNYSKTILYGPGSLPSITRTETAAQGNAVHVVHSHESPQALQTRWRALQPDEQLPFLITIVARLKLDIACFQEMCDYSPERKHQKVSNEHFEAHCELGADQGLLAYFEANLKAAQAKDLSE